MVNQETLAIQELTVLLEMVVLAVTLELQEIQVRLEILEL